METRSLLLAAMFLCAVGRLTEAQQCTYKFTVDSKDGCSPGDSELNDLQSKVTNLMEQNTAILKENALWRNDLKAQMETVENLTKQIPYGGSNAVYIRWGRNVCPENSRLIFSGYAAGSYSNQHGGTSDVLCLPTVPEWGKYKDGVQGLSFVYGAEYEISSTYGTDMVFKMDNSGTTSLQDHDIPCALCLTPGRSVAHTFQAKLSCPDGWQKEYNGYLMSAHYNHRGKVQAICVDEAPETVAAGEVNHVGLLLYNMEGICGSLPCPKYVNGRELTCVTCSF